MSGYLKLPIISSGGGGGSGDVVGPSSATDTAIAIWDTTSGKLLQDSKITVDVDGRLVQTGLIDSVFIGSGAGAVDDLSNNGNTGIGTSALILNTIGANNTAVGNLAGSKVYVGNNNSFFGAASASAGAGSFTGSSNSGFGYHTLQDVWSSSSFNLALGAEAGKNVTVGHRNIFVGGNAGTTLISGDDNILIGYGVNTPTTTTSDYLNIGDLIEGDLVNGNMGLGSVDYGSGVGVMAIGNGTAPSGTPTGGGVLYVESGSLKFKGSSGTITVLGVA